MKAKQEGLFLLFTYLFNVKGFRKSVSNNTIKIFCWITRIFRSLNCYFIPSQPELRKLTTLQLKHTLTSRPLSVTIKNSVSKLFARRNNHKIIRSAQMFIFHCCGNPYGFKDGAYYCYCAYGLRVSRYSDFQSPMLTNTGIFLRGLKLSGESRF